MPDTDLLRAAFAAGYCAATDNYAGTGKAWESDRLAQWEATVDRAFEAWLREYEETTNGA